MIIEEQDIVPLASLSESERQRRRIERDRILDLLEREEERAQTRRTELTKEQRQELLQKRRDAAKVEVEKLKAAKALQKKMGKALLRGLADDREKETKERKPPAVQNEEKTGKKKKSVAFADIPPELSNQEAEVVRRDSTSKPRNTSGSNPPVKFRTGKHPMKMDVVERIPSNLVNAQETSADQMDDDGESLFNASVSSEADQGDSGVGDKESLSVDENEDEYDLGSAPPQREIALEYYKKRIAITEKASKAMMSQEVGDEWNQPVRVTHRT